MAGFRALTAEGPAGLRVEAIARALKVSKGSFYWHFKDAPALKTAMLAHWVTRATEAIIGTVSKQADNARARLRLLADLATEDVEAPYGGRLVEAAIRDWARFDAEVAETVTRVDRARLDFLESLFAGIGEPAPSCRIKANLVYASLIGLQHLSHHGMADLRGDLAGLLDILIERENEDGHNGSSQ